MLLVQVNFLTKLVALKPGKTVHEMILNVMLGKDEGADNSEGEGDSSSGKFSGRIAGRVSLPHLISGSFLRCERGFGQGDQLVNQSILEY